MNTMDEKPVIKVGAPASASGATAVAAPASPANVTGRATGDDAMQGEGNPKAAAAFNKAEQEFVAAGKVPAAARAAAPRSETERQSMLAAEQAARRYPSGPEAAQKKSWSHLAKGPGKDAGEADAGESKR